MMATTRGDLSEFENLSEKVIRKAIIALKKVEKQWQQKKDRRQLLLEDDNSNVFLQICLKKIPEVRKTVKIYLPHLPSKDRQICLITGDLDKKNPRAECEETVEFYKNLLREHQVSEVTEIISLRELNTDYKQYEARRRLCNAYDIFLSDKKIAGCLPNVLGKVFIKCGKLPRQINMKSKNLKKEITNALAYSIYSIKERGATSVVHVGNIKQTKDELVSNLMTTITKVKNVVPGNCENIHSLHIKCPKSLAIPLYMSLESANKVQLPSSYIPVNPVEDELTTLPNSKVRVFPDGTVEVTKLPDVNYCDIDGHEKEILKYERFNAIKNAKRLQLEEERLMFLSRKFKRKQFRRKKLCEESGKANKLLFKTI